MPALSLILPPHSPHLIIAIRAPHKFQIDSAPFCQAPRLKKSPQQCALSSNWRRAEMIGAIR